jgi:DNA-binding NtrC family response regulator
MSGQTFREVTPPMSGGLDSLIESELFGHRRGAFTGATSDRAGFLELADGGTLFLDEIGDLSPRAQAKLLRVLETRKFHRVGGSREIEVTIRVIAATNQDLSTRIKDGSFRADLFYRLNLFDIRLTPLRDRRRDVLPLTKYFLRTYCQKRGLAAPEISKEAKKLLLGYDYPGNVRELRNITERALILSRGDTVQDVHLPIQPRLDSSTRRAPEPDPTDTLVLDERTRILAALDEVKWNRRKAADLLGMAYSTLRYKIDKMGLKN